MSEISYDLIKKKDKPRQKLTYKAIFGKHVSNTRITFALHNNFEYYMDTAILKE